MTKLEQRTAQGLRAFRQEEGFTLTWEQYEALVDQMALMCCDVTGVAIDYAAFCDACGRGE